MLDRKGKNLKKHHPFNITHLFISHLWKKNFSKLYISVQYLTHTIMTTKPTGGQQGSMEDQLLRLKFRSITFTAPRRQQQVESVGEDKKAEQSMRSYQTWKRVNAAYFDEPAESTARSMQQYDEKDYQQVDREKFRRRNKDTEFMEFAVRDKALARK